MGDPNELTDVRIERAFADVASGLSPIRERVLARIDVLSESRRLPRAPARRPFARTRRILYTGFAIAAALLLVAYAGLVVLRPIQRQALALEAKTGVRNLAMVLRTLKERAQPASLESALARLGVTEDPYGYAYVYDAPSRVYSVGANGRDEHGQGDDIVAFVQ